METSHSEEMQKCIDSPYYFCTNYLLIKTSDNKLVKFTTRLSEEQFNNLIKLYTKQQENE